MLFTKHRSPPTLSMPGANGKFCYSCKSNRIASRLALKIISASQHPIFLGDGLFNDVKTRAAYGAGDFHAGSMIAARTGALLYVSPGFLALHIARDGLHRAAGRRYSEDRETQ